MVYFDANNAKLVGWGMGMGFAPTQLRQVSPLLHMTTLTTGHGVGSPPPHGVEVNCSD